MKIAGNFAMIPGRRRKSITPSESWTMAILAHRNAARFRALLKLSPKKLPPGRLPKNHIKRKHKSRIDQSKGCDLDFNWISRENNRSVLPQFSLPKTVLQAFRDERDGVKNQEVEP
jgi:hypothetical protein